MPPLQEHPSDITLDQLYYRSPSPGLSNDEITSLSWNDTENFTQYNTHSEGEVELIAASKQSKQPSQIRLILIIIGLSLSAVLPGILGLAFYLSLAIGAPHGQFLSNGTYIRPNRESFAFNEAWPWASIRVSPLLVGTVSSTLIGIIAPLVMMLFAYHLANHWLKVSRTSRQFRKLPSPFQYFLMMNFITNSTPFSVLRFLIYACKPPPSNRQRLSLVKRRPSRASLSPILLLGLAGLSIVLVFTWSIKVTNMVLHKQIVTVLQDITEPEPNFKANAMIAQGCDEPNRDACGVVRRARDASQGGANSSSEFQIYQATSSSRGSISFIGPALPNSTISFNSSHTYAVGTVCEAFHPTCEVRDMVIQFCTPGTPPPHGIGPWNSFIYKHGFNTTTWKQRLQSFITEPGRTWRGPLTNGANVNPFTIATFGCFQNYSDIVFDNRDLSFRTPHIDWWSYGQGIIQPIKNLCSITICNTTIYDAQYSLTQGKLELINDSLSLANASATIAISGAAVFLQAGDSDFYRYAPRFLDDQLQSDLNEAGNTYGNDSQLFTSAWAQAVSNRMIGWSVGAIKLNPIIANSTRPQIATSIPLPTAYLFLGLHISFSIFILLLGVSALCLPGVIRKDPRFSSRHDNVKKELSQEDLKLNHVNLSLAQETLSDPTLLIHDLMITKRYNDSAASTSLLPHQTQTSVKARNKKQSKKLSEFSEGEQLKVILSPDTENGLGLHFVQ